MRKNLDKHFEVKVSSVGPDLEKNDEQTQKQQWLRNPAASISFIGRSVSGFTNFESIYGIMKLDKKQREPPSPKSSYSDRSAVSPSPNPSFKFVTRKNPRRQGIIDIEDIEKLRRQVEKQKENKKKNKKKFKNRNKNDFWYGGNIGDDDDDDDDEEEEEEVMLIPPHCKIIIILLCCILLVISIGIPVIKNSSMVQVSSSIETNKNGKTISPTISPTFSPVPRPTSTPFPTRAPITPAPTFEVIPTLTPTSIPTPNPTIPLSFSISPVETEKVELTCDGECQKYSVTANLIFHATFTGSLLVDSEDFVLIALDGILQKGALMLGSFKIKSSKIIDFGTELQVDCEFTSFGLAIDAAVELKDSLQSCEEISPGYQLFAVINFNDGRYIPFVNLELPCS